VPLISKESQEGFGQPKFVWKMAIEMEMVVVVTNTVTVVFVVTSVG